MRGLIEIVLEAAPGSNLVPVLRDVIGDSEVTSSEHSEKGSVDFDQSLRYLLMPVSDLPFTITYKLDKLVLGDFFVGDLTLVQAICDLDGCAISISFEYDDVAGGMTPSGVGSLRLHLNSIADTHGISKFYCGYEPAIDESTRFFTNMFLGPLLV